MMIRSILVLALVLGVAACGRKGMPEWPDDVIYPRDYPYTPLPNEPKAKKPDLNTNSGY
ncbi:hypothetical protein CCC_00986 [Paramagnetospirillum magnetotacticum MS-1]|uniref:Lipoprotein n=1 Tax=Paramagnetospirillum magnetotacticum MS-1 TaxID=272627 RepID=A0A0C2YT89_PARME|nr:lipoprotein [Paramagnetospirillum magnetotacticum]KIL97925.1 hypothetical protein CCC_00986 [Paramagnetospirillum magnetotacticum MS-1]